MSTVLFWRQQWKPIGTPPSLVEAVLWVVKLGSFLARKSDGTPDTNVPWRGFQHLQHITDMFFIMRRIE